jgi:hypothetical protein
MEQFTQNEEFEIIQVYGMKMQRTDKSISMCNRYKELSLSLIFTGTIFAPVKVDTTFSHVLFYVYDKYLMGISNAMVVHFIK